MARLGVALVPERSKVFESLSVDENLDAAVGQREVSKDMVYDYFPLAALRRRAAVICRAESARCSASARR